MSRSQRTFGILAALPEELGSLREHVRARESRRGLELLELDLGGTRALACVGGVGKVAAARATTELLAAGVDAALLVVGTCGALRKHLPIGTLVHCTIATQTDFALRDGREVPSDERLRALWRAAATGEEGWFLTADRPVLSLWRRMRLARAFAGPCVADMETASAAWVARAAHVPWAALRAVTDDAGTFAQHSFRTHYRTQAGRAADTVSALLESVRSSRFVHPVEPA